MKKVTLLLIICFVLPFMYSCGIEVIKDTFPKDLNTFYNTSANSINDWFDGIKTVEIIYHSPTNKGASTDNPNFEYHYTVTNYRSLPGTFYEENILDNYFVTRSSDLTIKWVGKLNTTTDAFTFEGYREITFTLSEVENEPYQRTVYKTYIIKETFNNDKSYLELYLKDGLKLIKTLNGTVDYSKLQASMFLYAIDNYLTESALDNHLNKIHLVFDYDDTNKLLLVNDIYKFYSARNYIPTRTLLRYDDNMKVSSFTVYYDGYISSVDHLNEIGFSPMFSYTVRLVK